MIYEDPHSVALQLVLQSPDDRFGVHSRKVIKFAFLAPLRKLNRPRSAV
jgi:Protein of unknown function DUF72